MFVANSTQGDLPDGEIESSPTELLGYGVAKQRARSFLPGTQSTVSGTLRCAIYW